MRISPIFVVAMFALPATGWAQSSEGERRQACTGDAFRLCATSIPDRDKVRDCLTAKRDQLTPDCRSVVGGGRPGSPKRG